MKAIATACAVALIAANACATSAGPDKFTVRGVVTWVDPWWGFSIQDADSSFFVMSKSNGDVRPGSVVEANGIVRFIGDSGEMRHVVYKVKGEADVIAPLEVTPTELFRPPPGSDISDAHSLFGKYVTFVARLERMERVGGGTTTLALEAGGHRFTAYTGGEVPSVVAENATIGLMLWLTGVCLYPLGGTYGDWHDRHPDMELMLAREGGIAIADASPLWAARARRMAACVFALVLVLAGGFLVARLVVSQSKVRRLEAINAERKRMATDLHDSLEQNLAGIKVLLQSALAMTPDASPFLRNAIESSAHLLAQAKSEIRETIMNLRNDRFFMRSPREILSVAAAKIQAGGYVKVRTRFTGLPERLSENVMGDILFIMREAVANAVKHGGAKNVVIASDPGPGGFVLHVANDGEPFDPAGAPGPEQGHFGLSGMADRARRCDISMEWRTVGRLFSLDLSVPVGES